MKALLCLHGLLSSEKDFDLIRSRLKTEYDYIYTPTMPGHGKRTDRFSFRSAFQYAVEEYDRLFQTYKTIDIIGYSLGGVLGCYICQIRKVNRLILLTPAFHYINIGNYRPKIIKKSKIKTKKAFSFHRIYYFLIFTEIVRQSKEWVREIPCPVCILWGKDDFLVSEKSGFDILRISTNPIKYYVVLKEHNHYNIVKSEEVIRLILQFLYK